MSKTKQDPDYALKVEHAISQKYGSETVQHPQSDWSPQKEEDYLEQLKLLNQKLDMIIKKNPPSSAKGKMLRIKYATQVSNEPLVIAFYVNYPRHIKETYKRYIENQIRDCILIKKLGCVLHSSVELLPKSSRSLN